MLDIIFEKLRLVLFSSTLVELTGNERPIFANASNCFVLLCKIYLVAFQTNDFNWEMGLNCQNLRKLIPKFIGALVQMPALKIQSTFFLCEAVLKKTQKVEASF